MSDLSDAMMAEIDGMLKDRKMDMAGYIAVGLFETIILPGIAEAESRDISEDAEVAYALAIVPKLRDWIYQEFVKEKA